MNWYIWVIIGYVIYVFVSTFVAWGISDTRKHWYNVIEVFVAALFSLVVTPFIWLVSVFFTWHNDGVQYKTFTIHALTQENKVTLKNLGFQEGEFITGSNMTFKGFKNYSLQVYIQKNGRVSIKYRFFMNMKQKQMVDIIKNLPKPIDKEKEIEKIKRDIKWYQDQKKETNDRYNKTIADLNKKIEKYK